MTSAFGVLAKMFTPCFSLTLIMREAFKLCAHCVQGYTVVTDIINNPISKFSTKFLWWWPLNWKTFALKVFMR